MSDQNTKKETLRKSLEETLGLAEWSILRKHATRDVIILVDPSLSLLDVGIAIAMNDETQVQAWIEEKKLGKPSAEQLTTWETDLNRTFSSLIVQPYVLMQILNS